MDKKQRTLGIIGTGFYVPDRVLGNKDFEQMVETTEEWIVDRTGIRERRILAEGQKCSDIAAAAGHRALTSAGLTTDDIDLIIIATFSPDHLCPPTACIVQNTMGFKQPVAAFDISVACTGFVAALETAAALMQHMPYRKALVIGAEACSRFIDYKDRNSCILFGDGAGAVIVGDVPEGSGFLGHFLGADGRGKDLIVIPAGGSAMPVTHQVIDERRQYVHVEGREVFKFAVLTLGIAVDRALEMAKLTAADIDLLIPHQANIRIIDAAAKRYNMPKDRVLINVDRFGNTSAASIPIAMAEADAAGRLKRGMVIAMVAFGGGLTYGATVMKW